MARKLVKKKRVGGFSPQAAITAVETFRKLRPITNIGKALDASGVGRMWDDWKPKAKAGQGFKKFVSGASSFLKRLGFGPAEIQEISAYMASNYQPIGNTLIIL